MDDGLQYIWGVIVEGGGTSCWEEEVRGGRREKIGEGGRWLGRDASMDRRRLKMRRQEHGMGGVQSIWRECGRREN